MTTKTYERVIVDPPPDANYHGPVRAASPARVAELRRLAAAGVPVPGLMAAFHLSRSTVYRYLACRPDDFPPYPTEPRP